MKRSKITSILLIGTLVVALAALVGCDIKGGTNEPTPADSTNNEQPDTDAQPKSDTTPQDDATQNETVSTAMVVYADGDDVLLIDQDTQTPYFPTDIDDAAITRDGQPIDEDALAVGNIVKVTGDGVMLESYPGQYPGITSIEVTSVGTPADAEQYADIVSQVFPDIDPAEIPVGSLEYKTADAQASTVLNPYEHEWEWVDEAGKTNRSENKGSETAADGTVVEGIVDVRISSAIDAVATFSVDPTSVEIERTPLTQNNPAKVDPHAEDTNVPFTNNNGTIAFTIEPNYLYEIQVDFLQGEANYAFYTVS